jgi:hypothetical protein
MQAPSGITRMPSGAQQLKKEEKIALLARASSAPTHSSPTHR